MNCCFEYMYKFSVRMNLHLLYYTLSSLMEEIVFASSTSQLRLFLFDFDWESMDDFVSGGWHFTTMQKKNCTGSTAVMHKWSWEIFPSETNVSLFRLIVIKYNLFHQAGVSSWLHTGDTYLKESIIFIFFNGLILLGIKYSISYIL